MLKTKNGDILAVEELTGVDIVSQLESINPDLSVVLAASLGDNCDYKFYKASYQFGDKIIFKNKCYLPLRDGGSVAFNSALLPDDLYDALSYDPGTEDPLAFVLY